VPPRSRAPGRWSSHRAGPSSRASPAAGETEAFALDATNTAYTRAVRAHDRDSPASREVASIPIRIWLAGASSWVSFSTNTCHPALALAKVIGLTTTLLSGRQMQPAQAWLPMSIPPTYLMGASSPEEVDALVLIAHRLFLAFTIPLHHTRYKAAPRSARTPTKEARVSAHAGSAIWLRRLLERQPLAVATSLIDPFDPDGRGAVLRRRSLFT
jgi:hypothetical protein